MGDPLECQPDGVDGADGLVVARFRRRIGCRRRIRGGPFAAEPVGDLPVDGAGPDGPFGAVVGGGKIASGDEDEEMSPDLLEDLLQLVAGGVVWSFSRMRPSRRLSSLAS